MTRGEVNDDRISIDCFHRFKGFENVYRDKEWEIYFWNSSYYIERSLLHSIILLAMVV